MNTHRRGVAILLVLAILVLVIVSVAGMARHAVFISQERELDRSARLANDLRRSAEPIILQWLTIQSSSVVLPPEAAAPESLVLHHVWRGDREYELRITAWDQCGMLPIQLMRSGSPLRLALPDGIMAELEQWSDELAVKSVPGLDLFINPDDPIGRSPYPLPQHSEPVAHHAAHQSSLVPSVSRLPVQDDDVMALGALIATHQLRTTARGGAAPRINVNTAPLVLVVAAMREAGRGGIEAIRAARSDGRAINLADLPRHGRASDTDRPTPVIVSSSDVWAIRIDVRVDRVRRSWWRVYQRAEPQSPRQSRSADRLPLTVPIVHALGEKDAYLGQSSSGGPSGVSSVVPSGGGGGGWECVQSIVISK